MKYDVAIIGARGVPARYGGFETYADKISALLSEAHRLKVLVIGDAEQKHVNNGRSRFGEVNQVYSRYTKGQNTLRFYRDSLGLAAAESRTIIACGPAVGLVAMFPWERRPLFINPDGQNWRRPKWNRLVRLGFRALDWCSARKGDVLICDARAIEKYFQLRYRVSNTTVIPYGADPNPFVGRQEKLAEILGGLGLTPAAYHLIVARLEPENHVNEIIHGYLRSTAKYPLVIVGKLRETRYVRQLKGTSGRKVRFLGGVYEQTTLSALRAGARTYIHGHSVGGTNPSLLEGMASGNCCICHDNEFNREVTDNLASYFRDSFDCASVISYWETCPERERQAIGRRLKNIVEQKYTWSRVANLTARLIRSYI